MQHKFNMQGLLRGRLTRGHTPLRQPWALPEQDFLETCTGCGSCVAACSEGILVLGDDGYPEISFATASCSFCGDCAMACVCGALVQGDRSSWTAKAYIADHCLALRSEACRTCADHCGPNAITFTPQVGVAARPAIDLDRCTGCGACVAPCPVDAIAVHPAAVPR